ncbi:hypothetical protein [Streptomyces sp. NPDC088115]|uniref:hypothetical protein n=1 Tax=Streptomyces sp. NPDC088115 TaxID=3365824 RepID=UPI00380C93C4
MTVRITTHDSGVPIVHTDTSDLRYTYALHQSGALTVYKKATDMVFPEVEVIYGPTAWESVQGDSDSRP